MAETSISTTHIDYLQRTGLSPSVLTANTSVTAGPPHLRRLWHISGVGRVEKQPVIKPDQKVRLLSEDALNGLFGYKIPLAFIVRGTPSRVAISLGTWSPAGRENISTHVITDRQSVVKSVLSSLYPAINVAEASEDFTGLSLAGFVLGIPTAKPPDTNDGAIALDRLIRAMSGSNWACMLLVEPVEESVTSELRHHIIEEMRTVHAAGQSAQAPQPLLDHYTELLKVSLQTLSSGLSIGLWRSSVYLLGDRDSYYRLASLWRGIYSGDESLPEPIEVWDSQYAATLATNWSMPDTPGPRGPGHYQHPLECQTLLTSKQLAAYVHLPELETSGFAVNTIPNFDAVPPPKSNDASIKLGNVVLRSQPIDQHYAIRRDDLTRHVFIAGVTGAGKTNTIFRLLEQCGDAKVPFLVIEPAKAEYRSLLNDTALAQRLQVFTLGNERVSPFRLNPFEVLPGVPVSVHLDLLRSVFSVSFGMWTPLPQVLEQCLYAIYADRGWDVTSNTNHRLDEKADPSLAFPTLSDLAAKVNEVTAQLGYEERITADVRAALLTRINGLRTGGKGRMLDARRSLPMSVLLEQPTILELEGMGDDDDKAFVMGLLLIRLVEHRRAVGEAKELQHLLIIEEAHRLLTNAGPQANQEEANPRGKAVETFANLLSEVRAYGQGIIIADQVPVKLAPDVIKNTNLKIAHRIVAADDRQTLAGAMAMNEKQAQALSILPRGQAAAFSEGDDAPVLIQVPLAKDQLAQNSPSDERVAEYMRKLSGLQALRTLFVPLPACAETCAANERACTTARRIIEDVAFQRTFARLVQSTMEDTEALDRLWPDLLAVVRANLSAQMNEVDLLRSLATHAADWFAQRRGAQAEWLYSATETFAAKLRRMLLNKIDQAQPSAARSEFRQYVRQLHARRQDPFPACSRICQQQPAVCLYRYAAVDLIESGTFNEVWRAANSSDLNSQDGSCGQTWEACVEAGFALLEFADSAWPDAKLETADTAARCASLCFGQQMSIRERSVSPQSGRELTDRLIKKANHE
jgi:hypothetical protein